MWNTFKSWYDAMIRALLGQSQEKAKKAQEDNIIDKTKS
jgi:hypothetical protein